MGGHRRVSEGVSERGFRVGLQSDVRLYNPSFPPHRSLLTPRLQVKQELQTVGAGGAPETAPRILKELLLTLLVYGSREDQRLAADFSRAAGMDASKLIAEAMPPR